MNWTRADWSREAFEGDKQRYQAELDRLLADGLGEDDFRVRLLHRRIATVERALTDPRFGLTDGEVDT